MDDNFQGPTGEALNPQTLQQGQVQLTEDKNSKRGRKSIPEVVLQERREYVVALSIMGMSASTIQRQVNADAARKGWGEVSLRTIELDIAAYFRANRVLSIQDYDHKDQLRTAHILQMKKVIEKMSLHIHDKQYKWKPFEYAAALTELHKMLMDLAQVENWNLGDVKPTTINLQQNNITQVWEVAGIDVKNTKPEAIAGLSKMFEESIAKTEVDPDLIVNASITDV